MQDRIEIYDASQDLAVCELKKIVKAGEMTPTSLEHVYKLVDVIKDLDEIIANEEERDLEVEGYSQRSGRRMYRGNSYRSIPYEGRRIREVGYSRNDGKHEMLSHLDKALENAKTDEDRRKIQKMIDELEKE